MCPGLTTGHQNGDRTGDGQKAGVKFSVHAEIMQPNGPGCNGEKEWTTASIQFHRRKQVLKRFLTFFAFVVLIPKVVVADGRVIATKAYPRIATPDQRALIHFANGQETEELPPFFRIFFIDPIRTFQ